MCTHIGIAYLQLCFASHPAAILPFEILLKAKETILKLIMIEIKR